MESRTSWVGNALSGRLTQAAWVLGLAGAALACSSSLAQFAQPLYRPSTVPANFGYGPIELVSNLMSRIYVASTDGGLTGPGSYTRDSFYFTEVLAGGGNPSAGGTSTIVGAITAPLPGPSVRGRMSVTTNATFRRTHAGMPCVVLHWDRVTGSGTFGGIDYGSGTAFIATKADWASPLNIISTLSIFGFDASRAYELTMTSGDTRAVLHIKLNGVILHRLSIENFVPSAGIGAFALVAGPGETSPLFGHFRGPFYEQQRDTDFSLDGAADLIWVHKSPLGDQPRDREVWVWNFAQDGSGRPVLTSVRRVVGQSFYFQPSTFELARFDLGFKAVGRDLGDGVTILTTDPTGQYFAASLNTYNDSNVHLSNPNVRRPVTSAWLAVRNHEWFVGAVADFDGNLRDDAVYNNRVTGQNGVLRSVIPQTSTPEPEDYYRWTPLPIISDTNWRTVGAGDIDDDGHPDLIWKHDVTGDVAAWFMDELRLKRWTILGNAAGWTYCGVGRLDATPGKDIVWRNDTTGVVGVWGMQRGVVNAWYEVGVLEGPHWHGML